MRTNLELCELVLKELKSEKRFRFGFGFCSFVSEMETDGLISEKERTKFINLIYRYRPEKNHTSYYFFFPGDKQPRIGFLKGIIKKLEKKR